jgi:predicted  nucleic acid-binding Zn-ribbon protein
MSDDAKWLGSFMGSEIDKLRAELATERATKSIFEAAAAREQREKAAALLELAAAKDAYKTMLAQAESDLDKARAELATLREVTDEMLAAGEYAWMHRDLSDPESSPLRDCYQAMFDAALAKGGEDE